MDPIKSIGKILGTNETRRDAIHVAILPVVAAEDMRPGQCVDFVYGSRELVKCQDYTPIGIIDPFIKWRVKEGERVWLFLNPNTVTGMRHEWVHPNVDNQPVPKNEHEKWLRDFAARWNMDYDSMLASAMEANGDGYATARGIDLHSARELGGDHNLFWEHLEALTGSEFDNKHRQNFTWSCSC